MLVDLSDAALCRMYGNQRLTPKPVAHFLSQERILAQFSCENHPRPAKEFIGWLSFAGFGVNELISVRNGVQLLLFDEVNRFVRDEVQDNLVRLNTKTLGRVKT